MSTDDDRQRSARPGCAQSHRGTYGPTHARAGPDDATSDLTAHCDGAPGADIRPLELRGVHQHVAGLQQLLQRQQPSNLLHILQRQ